METSKAIAVQVDTLADPARRLQREALRLVCAAHTLGFAVAADALPAALGAEPDQVGDALERLNGEHLLVRTGQAWQGLHDLRTELLLDLLHTTPPPTLAATYGRTLALLPQAAHAPAARRAAVRLARTAATGDTGLSAPDRLTSLQERLHPFAEALGQQVAQLAGQPAARDGDSAGYLAGLLEAADRLDTVAYAHAALPALETHRPPTLDVASLALMTYGVAVDGLSYDIPEVQWMVQLARRLPERTMRCAEAVAATLPPALVTRLAAATDLPTAVRLCEAAEPLTTMTAEQAMNVYRAHIASLPDPPGSDNSIEQADRRAQLTASLASLARLHGPAVADAFGPPTPRAEDAVASDPYGCQVQLSLQPVEPVPAAAANLARASTYDAEQMLVVRAVAFARTDEPPPASGYRNQPGDDPASIHAQAIRLARRIFDACPDADLVNAEIWQSNRQPLRVSDHNEGVVNLRAGVVRREPQTGRSVAFQAAVAEALGAENWTTRLRRQAEVAGQLVTLLKELPARLRRNDNQRRRSEWARRVEQAAAAVTALSGRPPERQAVLGTAQAATLAHRAADLDQELRAKDAAKSALDQLTGVLLQVARGLDDQKAKRGAGFRLADISQRLREAREQGAPSFAGIGDTLPASLDTLATFGARLLTALGQPALDQALRRGHVDPSELDAVLSRLARETCERDRQAVVGRLSAAGVTANVVAGQDPNPIPAWQDQRTLVLVSLADWATAVATLQGWTEDERENAGVTGRVVIAPTTDQVLIPTGLQFAGAHGKVLPLPAEDLPAVSASLNLPLRTGDTSAALIQPCQQLVQFSYEQIRRASRSGTWTPAPANSVGPDRTAEELSTRFAPVLAPAANNDELEPPESSRAAAAHAMLQLCELVAAETGTDAGLAHQLAAVDLTALTTATTGAAANLYNLAHAADHTGLHQPT